MTGNRSLQRVLDDDPDAWWVTCVNVRPEARGHGIGVALVSAAVDHARQYGASILEGHPVDLGVSNFRPSPSALFTRTVGIFRSAGFTEVART